MRKGRVCVRDVFCFVSLHICKLDHMTLHADFGSTTSVPGGGKRAAVCESVKVVRGRVGEAGGASGVGQPHGEHRRARGLEQPRELNRPVDAFLQQTNLAAANGRGGCGYSSVGSPGPPTLAGRRVALTSATEGRAFRLRGRAGWRRAVVDLVRMGGRVG